MRVSEAMVFGLYRTLSDDILPDEKSRICEIARMIAMVALCEEIDIPKERSSILEWPQKILDDIEPNKNTQEFINTNIECSKVFAKQWRINESTGRPLLHTTKKISGLTI